MARDFAVEVMQLLDDYAEEVRETVRKDIQSVARATAKELRNTSPRSEGGGDYAKGWTTTQQGNGWVVFNRTHPRLTHLLEKGHVVRPTPKNPGKKTRVEGIPHIAKAEQAAAKELVKKVEEDLSK